MLKTTSNTIQINEILPDDPWAIGIYEGDSPFNLKPAKGISNPVLTRDMVSDVSAKFIADPFMVKHKGQWQLFFEILSTDDHGVIGLAESKNGFTWNYKQVVLEEDFHLSFPFVFQYEENWYMIPESSKSENIRLYKAESFPSEWKLEKILMEGHFADTSIIFFQEKWWMSTCSNPETHDELCLFYANHIYGPWLPHKMNPVIRQNKKTARPAGRMIYHGGRLIRFAQDCSHRYGEKVRAFEISSLTPTSFKESEIIESPILYPTENSWNGRGMHHLDLHQIKATKWLACVDGHRKPKMKMQRITQP